MLDTQGIESCWLGFELFSTSATKGDVVESDSEFIEHVALKLRVIFRGLRTSAQSRSPRDSCPLR